MPRPTIDPFWREQIRSISANNPKLGPGPVLQQLEAIATRADRSDCPALRTVGREQQRFKEVSEAERREYLEFRWPAAMERGDLPWEAAPVALELLRHLHDLNEKRTEGVLGRPLISTVRWLWRVTLARPDERLSMRLFWARDLAVSAAGIADCRLDIESWTVTGDCQRTRPFFGEVVTSPFDGGVELDNRSREITQGWSVSIPADEPSAKRKRTGGRDGKARKR